MRTIMQASLPLRASFPSAGRSFLTRREGQALNCPQGWDGGFLFTSTGCCTKVKIIIALILINNIRGVDPGAGYDNIGNCQYHLVGIARCLEHLILELYLKCRKGNRVPFWVNYSFWFALFFALLCPLLNCPRNALIYALH